MSNINIQIENIMSSTLVQYTVFKNGTYCIVSSINEYTNAVKFPNLLI